MQLHRKYFKWNFFVFIVIHIYVVHLSQCEVKNVRFPSGELFQDVSDEDVDNIYIDRDHSAGGLFKRHPLNQRLSFNINVDTWTKADAPDTPYFRAHPVFIECLQNVLDDMMDQKITVKILNGYIFKKNVKGGSLTRNEFYGREGISATLQTDILNYKDLVRSIMGWCPVMFSELGHDIGLAFENNILFIYMTDYNKDSNGKQQIHAANSNMSLFQFQQFCQEGIDSMIDKRVEVPMQCGVIPDLSINETYPKNTEPEEIVGHVDTPITRWSGPDFNRLIQFPTGRLGLLNFNISLLPSWCGKPNNWCQRCVDTGIIGNSWNTRCAKRMMAPEMFRLMLRFVKKLRIDGIFGENSAIEVLKAWEEPTSLNPEIDPTSLHVEGRQIELRINDTNVYPYLVRIAHCVGFPWIQLRDNSLVLAVPKRLQLEVKPVTFPTAELYPVSPPTPDRIDYIILDDKQEEEDPELYPLLDGSLGDTVMLADNALMSHFRSQEFRYMRIHPGIVSCFSELIFHLNKMTRNQEDLKLKVVRGFLSSLEQDSLFDPISDERYGSHTLGLAMHLNYNSDASSDASGDTFSSEKRSLWTLAEAVALVCTPIFRQNQKSIGIGMYRDGVYVDMRDTMKIWTEYESSILPSQQTFLKKLVELATMSMHGRVINPFNPEFYCSVDDPPRPQSVDYVYKAKEAEDDGGDPFVAAEKGEGCQPSSQTEFCMRSSTARRKAVDKLWHMIKLKHIIVDEEKLHAALDGCLGVCGTCSEGPLWESKAAHCSNLIHWMPFNTLNDILPNAVTNLYTRGDTDARIAACDRNSQSHCIDESPLFSILYDTFDTVFNWVPGKAAKAKLFDQSDNPSPLMREISRLYALNARGEVRVWIRTEDDIATMEDALKVVFLYNREVTLVHLHVLDHLARSSSVSILENMLSVWASTGCPTNSRAYLTPYILVDPKEHSVVKRSAEILRREDIIEEAKGWETKGLFGDLL